jgi:lipid II:glycine glycyltransferase (peptidoglycan interpeptide bridge formation enzyme)
VNPTGKSGAVYLRGLVPADLGSCNGAASFLQSGFWGSFKARFGWNARGFLADWEFHASEGSAVSEGSNVSSGSAVSKGCAASKSPLMVIRRRLGPGVSFAYVPWGPELPTGFPGEDRARTAALEELARALQPFLPGDTAFIRFDPPWYAEGAGAVPPPIYPPFSRSGVDIQAPDTVLVDLRPPEELILRGMKPKWRYNIGLAGKRGVAIRRADEEGLDIFYALLRETAKRDGISIHGKEYYETLFSHCRDYSPGILAGGPPELRLYLAEHQGEVLASVILLFRGSEGVYLYGASSDHKRNLMAPYALQWRAMREAKAAGCLQYDLFGIPPGEDPAHPMAGLYRFKTGFGGRIIHRPGSWDYTYRPLVKRLFTTAETLRKELRKIKRRRGLKRARLGLVIFACLIFLWKGPDLWPQSGGTSTLGRIDDRELAGDPASLIGLNLETLFSRYGTPESVHAVRGLEPWQDDVVFVYNDWDLYIYKDRVWQLGLKSAYGVSLGDRREAVLLTAGEKAQVFDGYVLFPLSGHSWPLVLRANLDSSGLVSAIFVYRSDV